MATTPENRVKAAIKKWLNDNDIYWFSAAAGPYSVHGVPDIIACYKGLFVGIEVKAPGKEKQTTANQKSHLDRISRAEGLAFVASSVQDVSARFKAI